MAVTVVGGYLGSGKTTLVNHLLRSADGDDADERIAVLVNDFGDVNVDVDLIQSRSGDTIELSNGCICCSMVDGLSEALDRIVGFDPRPARLVIETSGVADPATVAAYGHGPGLALDAVVVLVDAETVRSAADDRYIGQTIRQQLAAADVLVLNKIDLITADEVATTAEWLTHQAPDAFLAHATDAQVAPEVLFGRPSLNRTGNDIAKDASAAVDHRPENTYTTRTVESPDPVTRSWVEDLMAGLPEATTVRAKGLVHVIDEDQPFVLQRVGRRWTLRPSPAPWPDEPRTSIVIIEVRLP